MAHYTGHVSKTATALSELRDDRVGGVETVQAIDTFLTRLDETSEIYCFCTIIAANGTGPISQHHHATLSVARPQLRTANDSGGDVFVIINETSGKGAKDSDITRIRAVFADDDDERSAYRTDWPLEPHLIVESSPGKYHYYWLVDELPVSAFKGIQQAIAGRYGTDPAVSNPARLMRLPGFINQKRDKDGHPKYDGFRSRIVFDMPSRPYQADEIFAAFPPLLPDLGEAVKPRLGSDEVIDALGQRGLYLRNGGNGKHIIACPWRTEHTDGRAEAAYFEAHTNGYAGAAFKCQHTHCLSRSVEDLRDYLGIEKTAPTVPLKSDERLVELINQDWALVHLGGGREMMKIRHDPTPLEPAVTFHSVASFKTITATLPPVGSWRHAVSAASYWLQHKQRREYDNIAFDPSGKTSRRRFNLFFGFPVTPQPKSCQKFLDFVHEIICAQHDASYEYVLGWMAHLIQRPEEKPGTALVLRGCQGSGKNTFAGVLGKLVGRHYVEISDLERLLGRFNFLLSDKLLVLANESMWGGDRKKIGPLKSFITDADMVFEAKGVEPLRMRHYGRLIVASNERWAVPADIDDRRFVFLDVADTRARDEVYFRALWAELDSGGYAGLMDILSRRDLSGWSPRQRPDTEFGRDVIEHSMAPDEQFWFDVLNLGELPIERSGEIERVLCDSPEWSTTEKSLVHEAYLHQYRKMGRHYLHSSATFFSTLYRLLGIKSRGDQKTLTKQVRMGKRRTRHLMLPPIESLREMYDRTNHVKTDWEPL